MGYCKLKAASEPKEIKSATSLHVFPQKKYVAKAKFKDEDAECTSELGKKEHGENANMMETNIAIKVEEVFPAGINFVKEIANGRELQCMR